ncbi:MAG: guanylate kinase [Acidobacteriota bacterium]
MSVASSGNLVVLTAPSGTGKSTVVTRLLDRVGGLVFSVSHTTRAPRPNERDGVDYFFVDDGQFQQMVQEGRFLEWAHVHGHHYGTSAVFVDELVAAGRDVLLDIDVQGASQVMKRRPGAVTIFLLPPSFDELKRRLVTRATESEESIRRRLQRARREVQHGGDFRYVVVNDSVDQTADELSAIVLAERATTRRRKDVMDRIIATFVEKSGS